MGEEKNRSNQRMKKKIKSKNRNPRREHRSSAKDAKAPKFSERRGPSKQTQAPRRQVDPETAQYFLQINNLFESNVIDLEDYSAICGNALEETRGKEVELATDYIISHTLERLLQGCDLDQLCAFLRNCSEGFTSIATDKFGSHVAETALKSLAAHMQDERSNCLIEETLHQICQDLVGDAVKVMCCRYGSHVLRSLLCLCKGVPLDSIEEFHVTNRSTALSERMNFRPAQSGGNDPDNSQHGFTEVFKFLVREMLNHAKDEITTLRVNSYSSFVLQAALRLLVGDDDELLRAILIILRCPEKDNTQGFIETAVKQDIMVLLEDTASSHLLEVIVKVAPEALYNELLNVVFKGSLYEVSSHHCGNFAVQALIASTRTRDQVELIWGELGSKLKKLLEIGKSGVIASILAACQRLQTHAHECCQALAAVVCSDPESSSRIVPHILFLDSYLTEKSSWKWPIGDKMHLLGCLMLQTIFKYSNDIIQQYVTSVTSMEDDQIYQTAKDSGGRHVLEAFLSSNASVKEKIKIITKLRNHFGELAMHPSSSFTVEKCFTAGNLFLKEIIAAELLAVQSVLSKTKHGCHLLRKMDIDGFCKQPEQWKLTQANKKSAYEEFQAAFGSKSKLHKQDIQPPHSSQTLVKKKRIRHEESDVTAPSSLGSDIPDVEISMAKPGFPRGGKSAAAAGGQIVSKSFFRNGKHSSFLRKSGKKKPSDSSAVRKPGMRESSANELANLASKASLSAGDVHKLFRSTTKSKMKSSGNEPRPFLKKQKR